VLTTAILSLLILASAVVTVCAESRGYRHFVYCFKPLTTGLILLLALLSTGSSLLPYKYAVVAGLFCSLAGDVLLMLPRRRLLAGLVSFLLAHICYIAAFSWDLRFSSSFWSSIPFFLCLGVMSGVLIPHLGKMKLPVVAYEVVICAMAWRALERSIQVGHVGALVAFLGAVVFMVSDSLLAVNEFIRRYSSAQTLILSTYFCAQWLIALSV